MLTLLKRLTNFRLREKLICGFLACSLISSLSVVVAIYALNQNQKAAQKIIEQTDSVIDDQVSLNESFLYWQETFHRLKTSTSPKDLSRIKLEQFRKHDPFAQQMLLLTRKLYHLRQTSFSAGNRLKIGQEETLKTVQKSLDNIQQYLVSQREKTRQTFRQAQQKLSAGFRSTRQKTEHATAVMKGAMLLRIQVLELRLLIKDCLLQSDPDFIKYAEKLITTKLMNLDTTLKNLPDNEHKKVIAKFHVALQKNVRPFIESRSLSLHDANAQAQLKNIIKTMN
ncbi:MAG: hypothetical protein D6820_03525, partial [Lentisphaerae bacterium]